MAGAGVPLVKYVLYGSMTGGQTWSTGFYIACTTAGGPYSPSQLNTLATNAMARALTWWGALGGDEASYCSLIGVRAYSYSATSSSVFAVGESTAGGPLAGHSSTPNVPYVSLVVSLRTAISGRSTRGRMYVPLTGANALDGFGQASSAAANLVLSATNTLLSDVLLDMVTATPADGQELVIASFTDAKVTPVTRLIVDSIPDTQHRRTDKLGATVIASAAYPTT